MPTPSNRATRIRPSILRRLFDSRRPTSINLGPGDPSSPIDYELLDAGVAHYRATRESYSLNAGMLPLRERIVAYHGLPHATAPKNAIVTVGAMGGLFATLMAVGDPGDEILILNPSFLNYPNMIEMLGMVPKPVALDAERGFALDIDAIVSAIGPRTRALLLNSPSNPTGRVDRADELAAVVAVTEAAGLWLISDETYRDIYFTDEPPPTIRSALDRAIVVSALSKNCSMTGFRLGYVLAPDSIAPAIAAVHQFNVTCAPTISQHIALVAFEDAAHRLRQNQADYVRQRAKLVAAVDEHIGLPYAPCEGGFFLFLDVRSTGLPSLTLAERLLAEAGRRHGARNRLRRARRRLPAPVAHREGDRPRRGGSSDWPLPRALNVARTRTGCCRCARERLLVCHLQAGALEHVVPPLARAEHLIGEVVHQLELGEVGRRAADSSRSVCLSRMRKRPVPGRRSFVTPLIFSTASSKPPPKNSWMRNIAVMRSTWPARPGSRSSSRAASPSAMRMRPDMPAAAILFSPSAQASWLISMPMP